MEHIKWYVTRALLKIARPLWGKPRIAAIVKTFADEVQELEDAAWALVAVLRPSTADWHRLKQMARLLDLPITTSDLETLRALVMTRLQVLRSSGLAEDVLRVLRVLIPDAEFIRILQQGGAEVLIQVEGGDPSPATASIAEQTVHAEARVWVVLTDESFTFTSVHTPGKVGEGFAHWDYPDQGAPGAPPGELQ
jgi:hypothetical protein